MLLLGTAGTGKTHTAKAAVMGARRVLGTFDAVKMVAHTGVAAANLGGGATTIDSLFQTQDASDLGSEALDRLVELLRFTELLVIDEISMVGAGQFEILSRRLEQVAKALWQEEKQNTILWQCCLMTLVVLEELAFFAWVTLRNSHQLKPRAC